MLLVEISGANVSQARVDLIKNKLLSWSKSKGLNDVEIIVSSGIEVKITKISANDVFEDTVLRGVKDE